jgi:hypothetical protein
MGDFSQSPTDVLTASIQKGYIGLHIEQGVPILDRDLNLLNDLIAATVRAVISRYVGNGVATGMEGFAIQAIPANNDFRIFAGAAGSGALLVGGLEATIAATLNYSSQPGLPALTTPVVPQPNPRVDIVYLDLWLSEVDHTGDSALLNGVDVGMQTSVRQKPAWLVRVAEGTPVPSPAIGHLHYPLARLTRPHGGAGSIQASMIADLRQTRLNLADVETRLRMMEQLLLTPAFAASPNQFNPKFGMPGVNVTLFGVNFNIGAVTVRFGTVNANVVGTPTPSQIVATVPTMAPGPVAITVQTSGGSVTSIDTFTVLPLPAPAFAASPNQFNPKFGAPGVNVTLFGTNFNIGTVTVRFGTTNATIVGTPTSTQIVAAVPSMPPGAVTITVQTGGGSATSVDTFNVL